MFALTLFSLLSLPLEGSLAQVGDSWEAKAPINAPDYSFSTVVNNQIFLFGAYGLSSYNTVSGNLTLQQMAKLPYENDYTGESASLAIAAVGNHIYVFGAIIKRYQPNYSFTLVYDVLNDSWSNTTAPPHVIMIRELANVVGDKIYLLDGDKGTNDVFDTVTQAWSAAPSMYPTDPIDLSAVIGQKIYCFSHKETLIYNTNTRNWASGAPIPELNRYATVSATTGEHAPQRVYVMGGFTKYGEQLATNYEYNPANNSWSYVKPIPTIPLSSVSAAINDKIYLIGISGFGGQQDSPQWVNVYTPANYSIAPLPTSQPTSTPSEILSINDKTYDYMVEAVVASILIIALIAVFYKLRKGARQMTPSNKLTLTQVFERNSQPKISASKIEG